MTNTGRPTGVGGKSLAVIRGDSSTVQEPDNSGNGSENGSEISEGEAVYRRNIARLDHNERRAQRRFDNEVDVSDDSDLEMIPYESSDNEGVEEIQELLTSLDPAEEAGLGHVYSPQRAEAYTKFLAELAKDRVQTMKWLETVRIHPRSREPRAPPPKITVNANANASSRTVLGISRDERVVGIYRRRIEPHPALAALLANGHHLPLTLCTTSALLEMQGDPARVKYSKLHDRMGVKKELLDVSTWKKEAEITIEEWRDGYKNFPVILDSIFAVEVIDLFKLHFDALCEKREMMSSFDVILRFDIEIRQNFFCGGRVAFEPGSYAYEKQFDETRCDVMRESFSQPHPGRYQPYQKPQGRGYNSANSSGGQTASGSHNSHGSTGFHVSPNYQGSNPRPFQGGRPSNGAPMACLICCQGGHRATSCTRTTLASGKPIFSCWHDHKLLSIVSRKEACVIWNVGGRTPCTSTRCTGPSAHFCSFCGATDHHAHSKRCL